MSALFPVRKVKKELTPLQKAFLTALFSDEAKGNMKKAGEMAGASDPYAIARSIKDEIIEQAKEILALNSIKAVNALVDGMEAGNVPNLAIRIACAEKILDRVGITKKESLDINVDAPVGIFILPAKQPTVIEHDVLDAQTS